MKSYRCVAALVLLMACGLPTADAGTMLRENAYAFVGEAGSSGEAVDLACVQPMHAGHGCDDGTGVPAELSALGARGEIIAHVRALTLQILESDNSCSEWYNQAARDTADVFRSLHYEIDDTGTAEIALIRDQLGDLYLKYPWGARSAENGGRDSFIELNGRGPFFVHQSKVSSSDPRLNAQVPVQSQTIIIGPYAGTTDEAQITIMLHELGHIVGRLPRDDYSWDGRSAQNTAEVLRHCKREIRQAARQDSPRDNKKGS